MSIFGKVGSPAGALRVLSIVMGVFLVCMGLTKIGWLTDSAPLVRMLQGWRGDAQPFVLWYLDVIAIPGAPVFARVVMLAELTAGAALIVGRSRAADRRVDAADGGPLSRRQRRDLSL